MRCELQENQTRIRGHPSFLEVFLFLTFQGNNSGTFNKNIIFVLAWRDWATLWNHNQDCWSPSSIQTMSHLNVNLILLPLC